VKGFIMPRALIIGVTGQDGFYLTKLLAEYGYEIYGTSRSPEAADPELFPLLKRLFTVDLTKIGQAAEVVLKCAPDEIYYLAAHHFSSQDGVKEPEHWHDFLAVNVLSPRNILQVLSDFLPGCRFFYAASAHVFGMPAECPQTELTPMRPNTRYGITKNMGVCLCRYYRDMKALYACSGILYNHESPRRGLNFVTSRIARAAALSYLGESQPLRLLNLDAIVDWGSAQDYVQAMWLILKQSQGDDFIISTGNGRTVKEFAEAAFGCLGLRAESFIFQEQTGSTAKERLPYIGDSTKIRNVCGWKSLIQFEEMVKNMVTHHVSSLS
jgi:GDPmannose 4,6-dehydratase